VQDIEDLHKLGKEMSICSYYGSRESIPLAQIVAMPYSMLLSKDTRESLGIDLEDNIVVLDEAHNIVEALNSTYQVIVSNKQLVVARRSLWAYFKKYEKRLKGKNSFYIKQLLSVLEALTKFLRQKKSSNSNATTTDQHDEGVGSTMMVTSDFVFNAGIDNFNMFKLIMYLDQSELPKKLMGFLDADTSLDASQPAPNPPDALDDDQFESRHVSPLRNIQAFFKALTNATQDGRILVQPHNVRMVRCGNMCPRSV
jgi:chromosome transmission fidelity protein 1